MKNIVLIGMSGIGKTTKGKYIAKALKWDFVDTDEIIVKKEKSSIDNIFETKGENYFREIESDVILHVSQLNNAVISTGGGVVLSPKNIYNLRKNGFIFLLLGKIEYMVKNVSSSETSRPLLKNSSNLYEEIETLYKKREKLYLNSADKIIKIDNKTLEEISNEILELYTILLSCSK